jgi:hypothetical protein
VFLPFNFFFLFFLTQIQDASLGGSSDDEDFLSVLRGPSSFANAFLYVGLGTIAIGLVIAFVGTGEKGFKTIELRLIGPSLIGKLIIKLTKNYPFIQNYIHKSCTSFSQFSIVNLKSFLVQTTHT